MRLSVCIACLVLFLFCSSVAALLTISNNILHPDATSSRRVMKPFDSSFRRTAVRLAATSDKDEVDLDSLKAELLKYLEKRKEVKADERAKEYVL